MRSTPTTPRFRVNFNKPDWETRMIWSRGEDRIEHYHPAITWCQKNGIKYKINKLAIPNYLYDGDDKLGYDPYDVEYQYAMMFYSEHDAQTFINQWGEHN